MTDGQRSGAAGPADPRDRQGTGRSGLYLPGVIWALVFGLVAVVGITGTFGWVSDPVTRWVVAGAVAAVGLLLVVTALPVRRRRD